MRVKRIFWNSVRSSISLVVVVYKTFHQQQLVKTFFFLKLKKKTQQTFTKKRSRQKTVGTGSTREVALSGAVCRLESNTTDQRSARRVRFELVREEVQKNGSQPQRERRRRIHRQPGQLENSRLFMVKCIQFLFIYLDRCIILNQ